MTSRMHATGQMLIRSDVVRGVMAALAYAALAVAVFGPWLAEGARGQLLWPVSLVAAAMAVYVLGRRWIVSFPASLVSGAIYGFGPLTLYMTRSHPLTALLVAAIP